MATGIDDFLNGKVQFEQVNNGHLTEDELKKAIEYKPEAIYSVLYKDLTKGLLEHAVRIFSERHMSIKEILLKVYGKFSFDDMFPLALKYDFDAACAFFPTRYFTKEMWRYAIQKCQENPDFRITPNGYSVHMHKMMQDRKSLSLYQMEPEILFNMDDELVKTIARTNLFAELPEKYQTPEICRIAVENNPQNLDFVRIDYMTKEMVRNACMKDPSVLQYVPEEMKDNDLCKRLISPPYECYPGLPEYMKTKELSIKAVLYHPENIGEIPFGFITEELCLYAVKNGGFKIISMIPFEFMNPEICITALSRANNDNEKDFVMNELANLYFDENGSLLPRNKMEERWKILKGNCYTAQSEYDETAENVIKGLLRSGYTDEELHFIIDHMTR